MTFIYFGLATDRSIGRECRTKYFRNISQVISPSPLSHDVNPCSRGLLLESKVLEASRDAQQQSGTTDGTVSTRRALAETGRCHGLIQVLVPWSTFVSGAEVSEEKNAQLIAQLIAPGLSLNDRGETLRSRGCPFSPEAIELATSTVFLERPTRS